MSKPLFIPLKREYFEAFERGEKREEYRPFGPRWNAETCRVGRTVVLSLGYGKARRITGIITSFRVDHHPERLPGWVECYGKKHVLAACIGITYAVKYEPIDRSESRARLARVHVGDRFRAMFGEQVQPMPDQVPPAVECPAPWGFELWQHLHREHGLTLVESELAEIVRKAWQLQVPEGTKLLAKLPLPAQGLASLAAWANAYFGLRLSERPQGWVSIHEPEGGSQG